MAGMPKRRARKLRARSNPGGGKMRVVFTLTLPMEDGGVDPTWVAEYLRHAANLLHNCEGPYLPGEFGPDIHDHISGKIIGGFEWKKA